MNNYGFNKRGFFRTLKQGCIDALSNYVTDFTNRYLLDNNIIRDDIITEGEHDGQYYEYISREIYDEIYNSGIIESVMKHVLESHDYDRFEKHMILSDKMFNNPDYEYNEGDLLSDEEEAHLHLIYSGRLSDRLMRDYDMF